MTIRLATIGLLALACGAATSNGETDADLSSVDAAPRSDAQGVVDAVVTDAANVDSSGWDGEVMDASAVDAPTDAAVDAADTADAVPDATVDIDAPPNDPEAPFDVVAAHHHMCSLSTAGDLRCWGRNDLGQLGIVSTDDCNGFACSKTPAAVMSNVRHVAVGYDSTCATRQDGTLWCWGQNFFRKLGFAGPDDCGGDPCSQGPRQVPALSGVVSSAVGRNHICALLDSGSIKCAGYNAGGQIGNGTTINPPGAVTVIGVNTATEIMAGLAHNCALLQSGALACWGVNNNGELGAASNEFCSTSKCSTTPLAVADFGRVVQVDAGQSHTCALTDAGRTFCWGSNQVAQIVSGPDTCFGHSCSLQPIEAVGVGGAFEISVGEQHTCARLWDGTVKCWGYGRGGQLGYPPPTRCGAWFFPDCSFTPTLVPNVSNSTRLALGGAHTCTLLADASAMCWGENRHAQFGDGSVTASNSPVFVQW